MTACQAFVLPVPLVLGPFRTVMSSPHACTLCNAYVPYACRQLYVDHCMGWLACARCQHLAQVGYTLYLQRKGCVMTHMLFPVFPSVHYLSRADAMPVRFYRKSRGAVQRGWLAPWLEQRFLYVVDGEILLICHFHVTGNPPPEECEFRRGVSISNLVFFNWDEGMAGMVRTMHGLLRNSDHYDHTTRQRWCRALRRQCAEGLALRLSARALRRALPACVVRTRVCGHLFGL